MSTLPTVLFLLFVFGNLVSIVCWMVVVIEMFQRERTVLGVVSILLCSLGALIAFVFGWQHSREWNLTHVMSTWTIAFVASLLFFATGIYIQQI
ncbi:MAG TPA: hypothetical protein VHB77_20885 [Planctomycetaceae bacterium]|nr:hypothetical protein [Planctomycetaceae bacterium]